MNHSEAASEFTDALAEVLVQCIKVDCGMVRCIGCKRRAPADDFSHAKGCPINRLLILLGQLEGLQEG